MDQATLLSYYRAAAAELSRFPATLRYLLLAATSAAAETRNSAFKAAYGELAGTYPKFARCLGAASPGQLKAMQGEIGGAMPATVRMMYVFSSPVS